jgi:hypothetical protein
MAKFLTTLGRLHWGRILKLIPWQIYKQHPVQQRVWYKFIIYSTTEKIHAKPWSCWEAWKSESSFLTSAPRFLKEPCFSEGSQASPVCPSYQKDKRAKPRKVFKVLKNMSMEHWWNDIDRAKLKYSGKKLSQCHFVHHKSHMNWFRLEPGEGNTKFS